MQAMLPVFSYLSLKQTHKTVLNIRNFSIYTGTTGIQAMQRRRTWWASIFFGASSQEATTEVLSAGHHGLLQNALRDHAHLAADCGASAADDVERFSTNAEEMQRAAGEMDCAAGPLELDQGASGETYEMPMAVEGPLEVPVDGPSEPGEKRCVPLPLIGITHMNCFI